MARRRLHPATRPPAERLRTNPHASGGGRPAPLRPSAPRPPAGYYDPALDAQLRASQRGLGDLRQDTELLDARAAQDYTFGMEGLGRERDRGLFDLTRSRDRGLFDLGRDRDRGYEDIDRQVMLLQRGYQQLARRQSEGNRMAGVLSPTMAAKQMAIRAANMAIERQPLDTSRTRLGQDYATQTGRLGEDFTTQSTRLGEDYNLGTGRLGVDYARGGFDRGTGLTRAEREQSEFGLDIGEQMRYQATAAGWVPPPPPPRKRARGRARPVGPNTNAGVY